jgi:hypothetical protein
MEVVVFFITTLIGRPTQLPSWIHLLFISLITTLYRYWISPSNASIESNATTYFPYFSPFNWEVVKILVDFSFLSFTSYVFLFLFSFSPTIKCCDLVTCCASYWFYFVYCCVCPCCIGTTLFGASSTFFVYCWFFVSLSTLISFFFSLLPFVFYFVCCFSLCCWEYSFPTTPFYRFPFFYGFLYYRGWLGWVGIPIQVNHRVLCWFSSRSTPIKPIDLFMSFILILGPSIFFFLATSTSYFSLCYQIRSTLTSLFFSIVILFLMAHTKITFFFFWLL